MGKNQDIVVREKREPTSQTESGTVVYLEGLKRGPAFEKKLQTVTRNLVERLLPYFIAEGYQCPTIVLAENDTNERICLNDFVSNEVSEFIQEMGNINLYVEVISWDKILRDARRRSKVFSHKLGI